MANECSHGFFLSVLSIAHQLGGSVSFSGWFVCEMEVNETFTSYEPMAKVSAELGSKLCGYLCVVY